MKRFAAILSVLLVIALLCTTVVRSQNRLLSFAGQATAFSAKLMLWGIPTAKESPSPSSSYATAQPSSVDTPASQSAVSATSHVPSPPKGEETGTIETTTLSLTAANTSGGGVHISNRTGIDIDIDHYLAQGLPFSLKDTSQPQVLIVHTHATESYTNGDYGYYVKSASTRSTDNAQNTVAVGEVLAQVLNEAGIVTINDTTQHDYPNYTGGYARCAETIQKYLEKYPSIRVVIDGHRDAIAKDDNTKLKPTTEIAGKKAAQIMILAGCETDSVEGFPHWEENFRFCLQLQKQMEADYPGLARPMSFKACKYNFDLLNGSILLEIGTDANTLEEAKYAAKLMGNVLIKVLA